MALLARVNEGQRSVESVIAALKSAQHIEREPEKEEIEEAGTDEDTDEESQDLARAPFQDAQV